MNFLKLIFSKRVYEEYVQWKDYNTTLKSPSTIRVIEKYGFKKKWSGKLYLEWNIPQKYKSDTGEITGYVFKTIMENIGRASKVLKELGLTDIADWKTTIKYSKFYFIIYPQFSYFKFSKILFSYITLALFIITFLIFIL